MSNFDEVLALDASQAFLQEFAEQIVYSPKGGTPRTVTAVVTRHPMRPNPVNQNGLVDFMEIEVANVAVTGIPLSEFNRGGDKVELAYRKGGTAEEYQLHIPSTDGGFADAGMVRYEAW